jgi:hypothetical protein
MIGFNSPPNCGAFHRDQNPARDNPSLRTTTADFSWRDRDNLLHEGQIIVFRRGPTGDKLQEAGEHGGEKMIKKSEVRKLTDRLISNVLPIFVQRRLDCYVPFFLAFRNLAGTFGGFIVRKTLDDRNW